MLKAYRTYLKLISGDAHRNTALVEGGTTRQAKAT